MACYELHIGSEGPDFERMATATHSRRYAGRMPVAPARKTGTWKMAYADFLTALMAFFLLMWIVSGISPEGRDEIAKHFNINAAPTAQSASAETGSAAGRLFTALSQQSGLVAAGDSVVLAREADGVRIDLVDSARYPLFDSGSGAFTPAGLALAETTGRILTQFSESLSIEGHTDAFGGASFAYSNWELSSDRANEARRALIAAGLAPARIRAVTGLADTRPLLAGQPHLSANRRVSILVHTHD
ncbi:flagellar motor protein MotB [Hyphomonas sp.]|uniref:flagellar motor protein MotB n=2 Tax=Hyphomonas sp. TaxID=87 RepID=UPI003D276F69